MRDLGVEVAKALSAGINAALPTDGPVTVNALVNLVTEDGDWLIMSMSGSPPFITTEVTIKESPFSVTFVGHPDMYR